ncbi:MAG TPA: serine/threonine-protein kinase [Polyangiales bacterium]|nr:serine/threonine-protein kinase [Polyangiales bacterium]
MTSAGEIRSADPFLGQVVDDRYRIEQLLGAGAVGSVYRAVDRSTKQNIALKIWTTAADNEQVQGRFLREAKALSTLHHPNIVAVYGYGVFGALPYVAMEYVNGQTLEHMLSAAQPLDTLVACDVMTQVLQALAYAHGLGVIHRDLKPDNVALVKVDNGYVVKLLDFGLAKFLSPADDPMAGSALTLQGMVMGTPLYMPPEQAAGRSVDARVDVYAAGCVLFEMLSGRPPYTGESHAEIFRAHMVAPVPDLQRLRTDMVVAPDLQRLFERALSKVPQERFADAGEMLEQLLRLPRPPLRPKTFYPQHAQKPANDVAKPGPDGSVRLRLDLASFQPPPGSSRWPLVAAVVTSVCTALALAYALLR